MKYEIIIIGAGIVGLATAYSILNKNPEVKLLLTEKENEVEKYTTRSNNRIINS